MRANLKNLILLLFIASFVGCATPDGNNSGLDDGLEDQIEAELEGDLDGDLDAGLDESLDGGEFGGEGLGSEEFSDEGFGDENFEQSFEDEIAGATDNEFSNEFANEFDSPPGDIDADSAAANGLSGGGFGEYVNITGVDFIGNQDNGTIQITTDGSPEFSVRQNGEGTQFIIDISNANLPSQYKRPYDTKEFDSNIGFFQGYQGENSSTARFVIQLREARQPQVALQGTNIVVSSSGGPVEGTPVAVETDPGVTEEMAVAGDAAIEMTGVAASEQMWDDSKALNTRTLDEFLLGETQYYGHPISIEVKNTDIRDVFNFIAEESGLNLVLSQSVAGTVTLKLRDIPWDQAFIVLLQSKQLGYVRQGSIIRVESLQQIRAETDATRQLLESQRLLQPLRVQIFPVSYAKANELETKIKDFLSTRGKVKADTRTNSLIVTDVSDSLKKVKRLIQALDTQTPQVLIEGKVVEARESFERRMGMLLTTDNLGNPLSSPNYPAEHPVWTGSRGKLSFWSESSQLGASGGGDMNLNFSLLKLDGAGTLQATLDFLESEEVVKVVSSPRVVTLNNTEALIQQNSELPIFTQTIEDGEVQTSVEYKVLRLQLKVTPQVTADGGVIMQMFLERQFPGQTVTASDGTEASSIFGRSATTTVLVENGQTAVIGGIYQNDVTQTEVGIPFFRRIPILGSLFSSSAIAKEKNELLMFLTPRILNLEKAFGAITTDDVQ